MHYSKCLWGFFRFLNFCGFPGNLLNIFQTFSMQRFIEFLAPLTEPFNCLKPDFLATLAQEAVDALKAVKGSFVLCLMNILCCTAELWRFILSISTIESNSVVFANKIGCWGCWGCLVILSNTLRRLKLLKMLGIRR